jgi:single-strand DNA-binding protein
MNKVMLIGNLTKDPEIKTTSTGKKVASFALAINDGKDQNGTEIVQYFNLNAWDKTADVIEKYVKKGHKIMASGRLKNRSWDKPDGTKGYATDITVSDIELLTSRTDAERINTQAPSTPTTGSKSNSNDEDTSGSIPEIDIDSINVQMPF